MIWGPISLIYICGGLFRRVTTLQFEKQLLCRLIPGRGFERREQRILGFFGSPRLVIGLCQIIVGGGRVEGLHGHNSLEFGNGSSPIAKRLAKPAQAAVQFFIDGVDQVEARKRVGSFFLAAGFFEERREFLDNERIAAADFGITLELGRRLRLVAFSCVSV